MARALREAEAAREAEAQTRRDAETRVATLERRPEALARSQRTGRADGLSDRLARLFRILGGLNPEHDVKRCDCLEGDYGADRLGAVAVRRPAGRECRTQPDYVLELQDGDMNRPAGLEPRDASASMSSQIALRPFRSKGQGRPRLGQRTRPPAHCCPNSWIRNPAKRGKYLPPQRFIRTSPTMAVAPVG